METQKAEQKSSKLTFRLPVEAHIELKRWALDRKETLEVLMGFIVRGALKGYRETGKETTVEVSE
jgi:hypothetical protein